MSRIFITGDTHGDYDWRKLKTRRFPVQEDLTKEDYLIITGDFGGVFGGDRTDDFILKCYTKRNFTTLFVDGNHENHDLLDSYPVEEWNGGKVHRITPSVIHLMRGQVYEIDGRTFFTMGGAESSDKQYRTEGHSWWSRELPSDEEYEEAVKNLTRYDYNVDHIITHCGPEEYLSAADPIFERRSNKLTAFLSTIAQTAQYKSWYFGHYHDDKDYGRLHLLYNSIVEL